MKKIDFSKLEMYRNIEKTEKEKVDVRSSFANMIYSETSGIAFHALAYKIYNSNGSEEYDENECDLIRRVAEFGCQPRFIDAINEVLK